MESLVPVLVVVIGAALAYVSTQRHERKRRAEQYQLEQIEKILRIMVINAETSVVDDDDPVRAEILRDTKVCMALLKIYGDDEVLRIVSDAPGGGVASQQANQLAQALQDQGRRLASPKKWLWW